MLMLVLFQYPIQYKIVPDLVKRSKALLSDAAQEKINKRKWGFLDKAKGWWWDLTGK